MLWFFSLIYIEHHNYPCVSDTRELTSTMSQNASTQNRSLLTVGNVTISLYPSYLLSARTYDKANRGLRKASASFCAFFLHQLATTGAFIVYPIGKASKTNNFFSTLIICTVGHFISCNSLNSAILFDTVCFIRLMNTISASDMECW